MIECQHLPLFLTKLSANAIIRKNSSDSLGQASAGKELSNAHA